MKLITFRHNGGTHVGSVDGNSVRVLPFADMFTALGAGIEGLKAAAPTGTLALGDVQILAPIPRPQKLICIGLNYRDHAIESNMEIPKLPTVFNKFATSVIAPGRRALCG